MATNKTKIINSAQKYIQKGNFDKAIRELQRLIEEDPRDVRTLLKIGDIYSKKGDRAEATAVYSQVAEFYGEQGFFLKAVAVYKQILKYDPKNLEVTTKLAELYEHLGLLQEAMVQYQTVANFHEEAGRQEEALIVLGKMVDLDPDNVGSRVRLAEAYSRDGKADRAIEHFDKAASELKKQARVADYIKVAERLAYHAPGRIEVLKELARLYLERGDAKRAIAKLQVAFKSNAEDIETLEMLGRAFGELGQSHKTVFVNRELGRLYQLRERPEDARRVYEEILAVEPNDPEALEGLEALRSGPRPPTLPPPALDPSAVQAIRQPVRRSMTGEMPIMMRPEREDSGPSLQVKGAPFVENPRLAPDIAAPGMPAPSGMPAPGGMPAPSFAPPTTDAARGTKPPSAAAEVERLLTETDVYVKYGLRDKALEHLARVAQLDPDNPEAHTKMADLYVALGDPGRAAEALSQLVRIHTQRADTQAAEMIRVRMRSLAPGHPMAQKGSVPPPRPSELSIDIDVDVLVSTGEFTRQAPEPDHFSNDFAPDEQTAEDGAISVDLLQLPDDEPLYAPSEDDAQRRPTVTPAPAPENVDLAMVDLFRTGEVPMPDGLPAAGLVDDLHLKSTAERESPLNESSAYDVSEDDLVDERLSQSGFHRLAEAAEGGDAAELQAAYQRGLEAEAQRSRQDMIAADLVPSRLGPSDMSSARPSIPLDFEDPVDYSVDLPAPDTADTPAELGFVPPPRQISTDLAAEVLGEAEEEENIPLAEADAVLLETGSIDLERVPEEPVTDTFTLLSSELEGDDMLLGLDALGEVASDGEDPEIEEELDETDFLVEQGLFEEAREMLLELLGRVPLYPRAVEMLDRVEDQLGLRRPEHLGEDDFQNDFGGLDEVFANAIVENPEVKPSGARPGNGAQGPNEDAPENEPQGRSGSTTKKNKITYL